MMHQSESIKELACALCKAQSQIEGAVTDSANPFYKSKYADLYACWKACRDQLTSNGLCVTQTLDYELEKTFLVTTLMHISGEWIKGRMPLPIVKPGSQEIGSCITYCRRYSLSALVGLSQYDDDGEDSMRVHREQPAKQVIEPNLSRTDLNIKLLSMGLKVAVDDLNGFLKFMSEQYKTPEESFVVDAMQSEKTLENFHSKLCKWKEKSTSEVVPF